MNFKLGFALTLGFLVLVLAASITLAVLYSKKSKNAIPVEKEKPGQFRNPYLASHARALFDVPTAEMRNSSNDATLVGSDLALVSNFHNNEHQLTISTMKAKGKTVFVIDGEPNNLSTAKHADFVITTKRDPKLLPPVHLVQNQYLPYYASYFNEFNKDPSLLLLESGKTPPAPEFAVFCYSNCDEKFPGVVARRDFLRAMQLRTNNAVANLGRCYANEPHAECELGKGTSFFDNMELFRNFRFVIAFENAPIAGYISEKLVNPLLAGSVPIYFGAPDVADHFNVKRFINVSDFESFEACIEEVMRLENDPEAYAAMRAEPILINNELNPDNFPLQLGGQFYNELYHHVPASVRVRPNMITANEVWFVTFADGVNFCFDRIVKEAKDSGYFDQVTPFGPADLPASFTEKFGKFIANNKRGYGYWLWKPVVVQQAMRTAKYGDLIVYCDSGCTISGGFDRKVLEYYRTVLYTGEQDVLAFKLKFKASHWTKGDLFRTMGLKMDHDTSQVSATYFILRKTVTSEKLIQDWVELTQADPRNIDDSASESQNHPFFVDHRHDQSCFDMLVRGKKYPHVFISSDNMMDRVDANAPFVPTRKKL